jgi:hypothetical protein
MKDAEKESRWERDVGEEIPVNFSFSKGEE